MKIKSLYRDYIQKSRLFMYPLLDIKRGVSVTPIQTFMAWEGRHCFSDSKFILQYHLRDDQEFRTFDAVKLKGNPFFEDFHALKDGTGIYVFDFSSMEKEFWKIVTGKYSELEENTKEKIRQFFKSSIHHAAYMESYLMPQNYFGMYSDILGVKVEHFKACGELCEKPDLTAENLILSVNIMKSDENKLNLPSSNQQI